MLKLLLLFPKPKINFFAILSLALISLYSEVKGQVLIVGQDFDAVTSLTYANTGGATITGSSGAGDRPASSTYYVSATTAFQINNGTATVTFADVTGLGGYINKFFEFRLASWSIASTGNGADAGDIITVAVSTDGGTVYSNEVRVLGNANAYWHYSTGTGLATVTYDGNNAPLDYSPAAGGSRTTDGYSTVRVSLPDAGTQARLKITMLNNSANERWTIDDVFLYGTLSCAPPAAPANPTAAANPSCGATALDIMVPPAGVTYYWQGTNSAGTSTANPTSATYAVSTTGTYYVRAQDNTTLCWSATSGSLLVTVNTPVTITAQPNIAGATVCAGTAFSAISVTATGSGLTYQWYSNTVASNSGGTLIGGATTASYTPPSASPGTTYYYCIVSGTAPCTAVTSDVSGAYIVNAVPADPAGTITPLANPACGSTTLSYSLPSATTYWQTAAAGTSTVQNTLTDYTVSSTGTYYVRDYNGTCWSTNAVASAAITVRTPITVTTHPSTTAQSLCNGGSVTTLTVAVTGSGPTYQWYSNAVNSNVGGSPIGGATGSTYTPSNTLTGTTYYYCVISGMAPCTAATSNVSGGVTVAPTGAPAAPPAPTPAANPSCTSTTLLAMPSTDPGVTWYWQGTQNNGTSTANPTVTDYTAAVAGSPTYYVRAKLDGFTCWSAQTSIVLTINTPVSITSQPATVTKCAGAAAFFATTVLGTSPTYQWQVSTDGGTTYTNLTNVAPYSNVTVATMNISSVTGLNGNMYRCVVTGASPCGSVTTNAATLIVAPGAGEPTSAASAPVISNVGCNAFNISWTNGNGTNRIVVLKAGSAPGTPVDGTSYTASANFGSGSNLGASDFVVYNGTGSSVFVYGLNPSTTYFYAVYEYNGCAIDYLTSSFVSGSQLTGACSNTAGATALYVDACGSGCGFEGNNELIWGKTGSYGIPVATNSPIIHYNTTSPPATVYISTYATNAGNTTAMNTAVGACGTTTFIDASIAGYIPPNSNFVYANNCLCNPVPYDFSNLCGQTIYVIYGTNASWTCYSTGGVFGNHSSSSSIVYFDLDYRSLISGLDNIYNYDKFTLASGDGSYVTFDPAGGAPLSYGTGACLVPMIVLPVELNYFIGKKSANNQIKLEWETINERNLHHFEIQKSADAVNYSPLGTVNTKNDNTTSGKHNYSLLDESPISGLNYYSLYNIDNDGKRTHQSTIFVDNTNKEPGQLAILYTNDGIKITLNDFDTHTSLSVYNLTGQLLKTYTHNEIVNGVISINNSDFVKGMYIIQVKEKTVSTSNKIIIR